jgi:hypothetical protein
MAKKTSTGADAYSSIIRHIFESRFRPGMTEVDFAREDIIRVAERLGVRLPKNVGDVIYSFRYRRPLPEAIQATAGPGQVWIIRTPRKAEYRFALVADRPFAPNPDLVVIKVPDATPGIVARYAFGDEQALLARVRYNRLVDIFTGVTCYSLQNHLRTTLDEGVQIETDEVYVGVDKQGDHHVFPVQAKAGNDRLHLVQIEQDMSACRRKFPQLRCRPIGVQFMDEDVIALLEFAETDKGVGIAAERHYKLVPPEEMTDADLETYRKGPTV